MSLVSSLHVGIHSGLQTASSGRSLPLCIVLLLVFKTFLCCGMGDLHTTRFRQEIRRLPQGQLAATSHRIVRGYGAWLRCLWTVMWHINMERCRVTSQHTLFRKTTQ